MLLKQRRKTGPPKVSWWRHAGAGSEAAVDNSVSASGYVCACIYVCACMVEACGRGLSGVAATSVTTILNMHAHMLAQHSNACVRSTSPYSPSLLRALVSSEYSNKHHHHQGLYTRSELFNTNQRLSGAPSPFSSDNLIISLPSSSFPTCRQKDNPLLPGPWRGSRCRP